MINAGSSQECMWDGFLAFYNLFPFFFSMKSLLFASVRCQRETFPGKNAWMLSVWMGLTDCLCFWVLSFCYISDFNKVVVGYYHSVASYLNFFLFIYGRLVISLLQVTSLLFIAIFRF